MASINLEAPVGGEKKWGLADFRADLKGPSAEEEWRGSWATALLCRRSGLLVALWAARLGLTPTQITLVGLIVAISLPFWALVLPMHTAPWTVAVLGYLFHVLDCADGSLARVTNQSSKRGGDIDFLVDMAQWGLLYLAIGILADRTLDGVLFWSFLALLAAWLRLLARVIRDQLGTSVNEIHAEPPKDWIERAVWIFSGLSGLLPVLALMGIWIGLGVFFLLLYALLDIGDGLLPLFKK